MPSWAYLVVVFFVGLLAWPTLEPHDFRFGRRARRRFFRGRSYRTPNSASRAIRRSPADGADRLVAPIKGAGPRA